MVSVPFGGDRGLNQSAPDRAGNPLDAIWRIARPLARRPVCNPLWQATDDPRLADAARRWLGRTLDLIGALQEIGFLEGRAGALLALLAVAGVDRAWDRALVLSVRPASS